MRYGGNKNRGQRTKRLVVWEVFTVWNPNYNRRYQFRYSTGWGTVLTSEWSCRSWENAIVKALNLGPGSEVTFRKFRGIERGRYLENTERIDAGMITFEDILELYPNDSLVKQTKKRLGIS